MPKVIDYRMYLKRLTQAFLFGISVGAIVVGALIWAYTEIQ